MNSWIKEGDSQKLNKLGEKALAWLNPKSLAVILTIANVCSMIPLIWIGFYNYASADDFGEASRSHVAWMTTHNVFIAIGSGVWKSMQDWVEWMGYFTCNLLMAVSPITFGEKGYWLVAILMVGSLSLSTIYLIYTLFVKVFHFDKYWTWSISMLVVFITIQCMPIAGRVEAFYWYSGAVNYIFIHSLANFFYGLLLNLACCRKKHIAVRVLGTAILGFFVGGGNQMSMLNVGIVLMIAMTLITYHKKWGQSKRLLAPILSFYLGFILNVAAPGNFVRSGISHGMGPIKAILISLHYGLERCISIWTTWPVVLGFLMIGVLAWEMTSHSSFRFDVPLGVIVLAYGLSSAMMTPPLFAVGNMEAGRLQAITYVMYILLSSLTVVYVIGWCRYKFDLHVKMSLGEDRSVFSINYKWIIATLLAFGVFGSILSIIPSPDYYTFTEAIEELCDGSAKAFYKAHCERTELLHGDQTGVIEVEAITIHPALLFFSDISEDAEDWENTSLSRYLGIDGVVVRK